MLLRIRPIGGPKRSCLELEGTVLIYNAKTWVRETSLWIPVELISISENIRFRASRLIASLLSLLIPVLTGAILHGIFFDLADIDSEYRFGATIITILFIILLMGFVSFVVLLTRFFFRVKTICMTITPESSVIEFWKEKKNAREISDFVNQIRERQKSIHELFNYTAKHVAKFSDIRPIRRLICLIFLFSVPALIIEKFILLLLCVIPFAWFVYNLAQEKLRPKEYRQALRYYKKRRWQDAIYVLRELQGRLPQYMPGYLLLANVYVRTNEFDEAIRTASQLPDEYQDISQDLHNEIWKVKRLYQRRKEDTQQP